MSVITALEGCLSKDELEIEARRIQERFPETVRSYLGKKNPAKYDIKTSVSEPGTILIEEVSQGTIRVETAGNWNKRYWEEHAHFQIARLYPMHHLALIERPWVMKLLAGKRKLHSLGYVPLRRREDWLGEITKKDEEHLIRLLRDPYLSLRAADPRALAILDNLLKNINSDVQSLTFAEYIPRHNKIEMSGDYGELHIDFEKFVGPVKRLVDAPPELAAQRLEGLCKGLPFTTSILLTSIVQTNKGKRHIPMIDFIAGRESQTEELIRELSIPGMLVNSGQSYHFYGYELFNEIEWRTFTDELKGRFCRGVDNNWASFSLLQGFSMLRLVPGKGKLYQPCIVPGYKPVAPNTETDYSEFRRVA